MKFSSSLKKNHIFRKLYSSKGVANSYFVLYARPNRSESNRIGITVSKKLGHAVVRNRTRRRIREIYRLNEERFAPGWDIVVVATSRDRLEIAKQLGADYVIATREQDVFAEMQKIHPEGTDYIIEATGIEECIGRC